MAKKARLPDDVEKAVRYVADKIWDMSKNDPKAYVIRRALKSIASDMHEFAGYGTTLIPYLKTLENIKE